VYTVNPVQISPSAIAPIHKDTRFGAAGHHISCNANAGAMQTKFAQEGGVVRTLHKVAGDVVPFRYQRIYPVRDKVKRGASLAEV
jgi:hypothetical protein